MNAPKKNTTKRLSLFAYWERHIKGSVGYQAFVRGYKVVMEDPEFAEKFGQYRFRKLTPKQIELLNTEFL